MTDTIIQKTLARLVRAWRVKIRRSCEPGSGFSFWHVIDCDTSKLIKHIERYLPPGASWANYGSVWTMQAVKAHPVVTLDDLYMHFRYTNYRPTLREQERVPVVRRKEAAR